MNIAARVQSAAKASECFVTETVLDTEDAREAYDDIVKLGSSFKSTPARIAANVTARYIAPVSRKLAFSLRAKSLAAVLLPLAAGPSIVIIRSAT